MSTSENKYVIESRVHLFSALAEAAETEHNLMCLYLYSMFSLKRSEDEGVSEKELEAIERWRKIILGVCLEEMTHLSLVSNLFSALGGSPHFARPNFPVSPGMYPSGIVVELAPFDMKTVEHFIFLERPASLEMKDADGFRPADEYQRFAPTGRLMHTSGDYKTVGVLYEAIKSALTMLSEKTGEEKLFCGNVDRQITPMDSPLPGLIAIRDLKSALTAVETIITQGEGATSTAANSHFDRFSKIKDEYLQLLKANPKFEPGRKVARNPVMRKPVDMKNRVWVTNDVSARYMDLANAFYVFMLRTLVQVYLVEDRDRTEKHELLQMSFSLMHMMAVIGEALTLMPSSSDTPDCFAGMSFAMIRTLTPLSKENELELMGETLRICADSLRTLPIVDRCSGPVQQVRAGVDRLIAQMEKLKQARGSVEPLETKHNSSTVETEDATAPIAAGTPEIETAASEQIEMSFDSKKCIHSRHCVTELPQVFLANTPGKWLYPEKTAPDVLAAVIRECPSGALQYKSKGALKNEERPSVNMMRLFENGPYAFNSDMTIDGKNEGYRATLCRCGLSKRKPFCDHSHADAGFIATGEPPTVDDTALKARGGKLEIERTENGPYSVKGNVEICAGTGRVVVRSKEVYLCRCGHSKTKPICDGTHQTIGFKDSVSTQS